MSQQFPNPAMVRKEKHYGPLKPYEWPQDKVKIPNGQGLMPRIDTQNGNVVKKEGAVYSQYLRLNAGATRKVEFVIPIEADADFWCNQIGTYGFYDAGGTPIAGFKLNILDSRTGYDLTYPYIRWGQFGFATPTGVGGESPYPTGPFGYLSTSSIIQPYCFTRNGGIRILIDTDGAIPLNGFYSIAFIGWKEYQYASR